LSQNLHIAADSLQPFSGYWINQKFNKPDMGITVLLFDPLLQEFYLGVDVDDNGNEICIDEYGRELDGVNMWA